jgi:murein DD-endopeptidase MepM/ murein hydrolase activator NlpD
MAVSPFGTKVPLSCFAPSGCCLHLVSNRKQPASWTECLRFGSTREVNAETLLAQDYQRDPSSFPPNYKNSFQPSETCDASQMRMNRTTFALLFAVGALLVHSQVQPANASRAGVWRAPVDSPQLVAEFRQPTSDWSAGHRGVDYLVSQEQLVFAPFEGLVTYAGVVVDRSIVTITHKNGLKSSVEPVCPTVDQGDRVNTGQVIGEVCRTGTYASHCGFDTCLHFSTRSENGYLSPLAMIGGLSPSRLKPWDGLTCSQIEDVQC